MGAQTILTVPVKVQAGAILDDVICVFYIKAAVIVLGIIDTMFPGSTVVTGYMGLIFHRFTSFQCFGQPWFLRLVASPEGHPFSTGNTQYKVSNPPGRCAFDTSLGQSAPPLDSEQGLPLQLRRRYHPAPGPRSLPFGFPARALPSAHPAGAATLPPAQNAPPLDSGQGLPLHLRRRCHPAPAPGPSKERVTPFLMPLFLC